MLTAKRLGFSVPWASIPSAVIARPVLSPLDLLRPLPARHILSFLRIIALAIHTSCVLQERIARLKDFQLPADIPL